jgi:uncharacterized protein (DUF433 family)
MAIEFVEIVDLGRGPQLSTSRVTVQDLVPYFQEGRADQEILRWIPTLSPTEIAVVRRYYREHQQELDAEDERIRERNARRSNPPAVQAVLDEARKQRLAITQRLLNRGGNGDTD